MHVLLETERLILRRLTDDDAARQCTTLHIPFGVQPSATS